MKKKERTSPRKGERIIQRAEQQASAGQDLCLGGAGVLEHVVLLPALPLHDPEDALEDLDVAGDPERALVAEPELLLRLPEQLRERPVVQVLRGDHEPPHLVADVHGKGASRHAALSRRRRCHRGQLLPLLEQLLKPHDVHDLVARPATLLLLHFWCGCRACSADGLMLSSG
jgi:hypothetical protein